MKASKSGSSWMVVGVVAALIVLSDVLNSVLMDPWPLIAGVVLLAFVYGLAYTVDWVVSRLVPPW